MTPQHLKRNNIILLVSLVALMTVFPLLSPARIFIRTVILAAIVLSSMFCLDFRRRAQRAIILTGVAVILLLFISSFANNDYLDVIDFVVTFLFLLLIVGAMVRHIGRTDKVDAAIIVSSVNGYLLLGVLWSLLLYSAYFFEARILSVSQPIIFPGDGPPAYHDFIYFSFVTLTTLGYGDVIPVSQLSRAVTMLICISGQFYMTLLVALLVGKYLGAKKDN
jgi:voltage-gated potassium channel